ncbi:hypothetical protein [Bizionia paragorgiae]|uniref:Uncharacterized protein n=1 Tax=Bizionia paragorgiae TaxID=283786 RepID=A0A1H4DEM9_BIZPA|nr:hypothetical protein [Bizionia paragorgiae]SEA71215.1 hypothetical protein SAMN04487990_1303 [Bizionia paragorgiae]
MLGCRCGIIFYFAAKATAKATATAAEDDGEEIVETSARSDCDSTLGSSCN